MIFDTEDSQEKLSYSLFQSYIILPEELFIKMVAIPLSVFLEVEFSWPERLKYRI